MLKTDRSPATPPSAQPSGEFFPPLPPGETDESALEGRRVPAAPQRVASSWNCSRCQQMSPLGTSYCPRCGEALDPALLAELQWLAVIMRTLDQRIATGLGEQKVAELRAEYFTRYQNIRRVRPAVPLAAPTSAPVTSQVAQATAWFQEATKGRKQVDRYQINQVMPPPLMPPQTPTAAAPVRTAAPAEPAFSWRAFVSEQAIAILAYLGGFLALVATLTLVVSQAETLPLLTLLVVCAAYVAFGIAGLVVRRIERLRTVGRVYLGVFALSTPLVMLALYRFQLQQLNVPVAGMLCLSAVYAMLVYLALAVQTRFLTYAYLGWVALIVAALSILPWTQSDWQWSVFALGVVTLLLLAPRQLRRHFVFLEVLSEPATQVAAVATIPVVLGVQVLGLLGLVHLLTPTTYTILLVQAAPLALGACILVPITVGWRLTIPGWRPQQREAITDVVDGFNAVFFAEAVGGVSLWIHQATASMAYTLAATALVEFGLAFFLLRTPRQRRGLRSFLEILAVGLACGGASIVAFAASPNWPLVAALCAGVIVTVGAALLENGWWLLGSGVFLTLDYFALAFSVLPSAVVTEQRATFSLALALALWLGALALGLRARTRRLVAPVYVVALGDALLTTALLPGQTVGYQVALLLTFTGSAFIAGWRERMPLLGNLVVGLFGMLAVWASVVNDLNGLHASLLVLGFAGTSLLVRWLGGRAWALGPAVVTLWGVIVTASYASLGSSNTPDWTMTGLPFAAWFLMLFALLGIGVALWEGQPVLLIATAGLALWVVFLPTNNTTGDIASVALIATLVAAGAALRQWRGPWWGTALELVALAGSVVVAGRLMNLGPSANKWQVAFLLGCAVASYLVAVQERLPVLTSGAVIYVLAAALLLPGPENFLPTLLLTFTLAAQGSALRLPSIRRRVRRSWAYAPYAASVGCSILATLRVTPADAAHLEMVLLIFGAVSYLLVVLEGEPLSAIVPLLYGLAAVLVQPDAHALLPLAVVLAVLGLAAGRVAGLAWSWPFYGTASVAAVATALLGLHDSAFEALTLLALALLAYVIALVESRPDIVPVALVLGTLALSVESSRLAFSQAEATLAFVGLGWLYTLGAWLWKAIPWLRPRGGAWWATMATNPQPQVSPQTALAGRQAPLSQWLDPRRVGMVVHLMAGYLLAGGTALMATLLPGGFSPHEWQTLAAAFALLSLAGLLALAARQPRYHVALYGAGFLVALAITWGWRWLGAENPQAFILAPGSYLLLVGAFLPADRRVPEARPVGQATSLVGALALLLPTLYQSFTEPDLNFQLLYGLVVLGEALVIIVLGVGTRSRILTLTGSTFVGIDTLSGVGLALRSGVSPAIIFAVLAVLLIGAATWLSLRRPRHGAPHP